MSPTTLLPGVALRDALRVEKAELRRSAWSPDGRCLAVPSADRLLRLWEPNVGGSAPRILTSGVPASCAAWSPDGKTLASGMVFREAILWDIEKGQPRSRLTHPASVTSVVFAPDGQSLVTGGTDDCLRIWDLVSGERRRKLGGHSGGITDLAWQPDGALVASSSLDRSVRLWDGISGEELLAFRGHSGAVLALAWSPDGRTLVSASTDGGIRIWDSRTGTGLGCLEAHEGPVVGVGFSFDGRLLASKSLDGTVRLWDAANWRVKAVLNEPAADRNLFGTAAFHPHLPLLATLGEHDTVVRLWDLDIEAVLAAPLSSAMSPPPPSVVGHQDLEEIRTLLTRKREAATFDVFLCHNSEDKPAVKRVGRILEQLGLLPWLDQWELRPGFPWQEILEAQILDVKAAAVFVGPGGFGPWQNQEQRAFLREFVERRCPVIPVILPGCPTAPKLPPFLSGLTWVDLRETEPNPLEQLVWGITDRRPDRAGDLIARRLSSLSVADFLTEVGKESGPDG